VSLTTYIFPLDDRRCHWLGAREQEILASVEYLDDDSVAETEQATHQPQASGLVPGL
jgi:hypothetical protein